MDFSAQIEHENGSWWFTSSNPGGVRLIVAYGKPMTRCLS
jgi:hypothetical protein